MTEPTKKLNGQFYTINSFYILKDMPLSPPTATKVIEPFAGKGDLLDWLKKQPISLPVEAYDIDPKTPVAQKRDTLANPPSYTNAWVLTNPPYLARNKCSSKTYFDKYDTNDLYKCFMLSLVQDPPEGGLLIIPVGFFLSPRDVDVRCRNAFLSKFKVLKVKYFEEDVFPDTSTTVIALSFEKSPTPLIKQQIEWLHMPSKETRTFELKQEHDWIIGGDIYSLKGSPTVQIRRHVEGQSLRTGEQLTNLLLTALDSGKEDGRISLAYKENYVYPAKDTSRAYATFILKGKTLTAEQQTQLAAHWTAFIEKKRHETWSLFLPQFRESKEYARKRIPFELAYALTEHFIQQLFP
jgi:hypothetical protein